MAVLCDSPTLSVSVADSNSSPTAAGARQRYFEWTHDLGASSNLTEAAPAGVRDCRLADPDSNQVPQAG